MAKEYSLYEAKARLSEIVRRVREHGESVTISYHGERVAEIGPIEAATGDGFGRRVQRMAAAGSVMRAAAAPRLKPLAKKKGALKRFLDERD